MVLKVCVTWEKGKLRNCLSRTLGWQNSSSLTRRTTYNQLVESNRRWEIDFQFTDSSIPNQKPRCCVVSMASAPVTDEGPLFWSIIQVRLRQKTGSPVWIVFCFETECTPLDSFININDEQHIGTQIFGFGWPKLELLSY